MEYPFKDLMALDEATARDGYYKDWTHIDADIFHQISELAKFIREKGRGADTREAIAQALERVYHDAAISGNANMEVSQARGSYPTLAERLMNLDKVDRENLNKLTNLLADKIKKGQVTMADLTQEVREVLNGDRPLPIVGKDSVIGYENIVKGTVTGIEIASNTISLDKLKQVIYEFEHLTFENGMISAQTGEGHTSGKFDILRTVEFIEVQKGDVIRTDEGWQINTFFYSSNSVSSFVSSPNIWVTTYTIPNDGYLRFQIRETGGGTTLTVDSQVYKYVSIHGHTDLGTQLRLLIDGNLSNKVWLSLGDSITKQERYQPLIAATTGLKYVNYGISGTTIAKKTADDTTAMSVRYQNMQATADIITVWGGVNDFGFSYGSNGGTPLGIMGDTTADTFYGALDVLIKGLNAKYDLTKVKLGFIITPKVASNDVRTLVGNWNVGGGGQKNKLGFSLEDYVNAIKEVCSKYSIPYLDLFENGGMSDLTVAKWTEGSTSGVADGLHPNVAFHQHNLNKYIEFLNEL